ncbi:MAG: FkbM family methyltransferase [Terriglobia bacterium]
MDDTHANPSFAHEVPTQFVDYARTICRRNPVICDIGSRDALEAIFLCRALHAAECHIFEPNPPAAQLCETNIAKYGRGCNVIFNSVALSDRVGTVDFYPVDLEQSENRDLGFSSMLPVNPAYASTRRGKIVQKRITVSSTTLDSYFRGRQRRPDLLWIDVEGSEKLVLSGGEEVLTDVALIHIEVSFRPMQIGKPLFWEIDEFLRTQRFRLLNFIGVSRVTGILVVHRLLPNLPWRWNAVYCRGVDRK